MDARDWQKNEGRRMLGGALLVSSSRFQLLKRNTEYTETSMELGNNENRERNEREDPVLDGGSTSARREASAVPQVLRLASCRLQSFPGCSLELGPWKLELPALAGLVLFPLRYAYISPPQTPEQLPPRPTRIYGANTGIILENQKVACKPQSLLVRLI